MVLQRFVQDDHPARGVVSIVKESAMVLQPRGRRRARPRSRGVSIVKESAMVLQPTGPPCARRARRVSIVKESAMVLQPPGCGRPLDEGIEFQL